MTGKGRNRNFSTKLAIWDWIFGTAYKLDERVNKYGLKTYFPDNLPNSFYMHSDLTKKEQNVKISMLLYYSFQSN